MHLVDNVAVVGPFEEKEEGIGIASNVVEVQGEDPDTPGSLGEGHGEEGCRRFQIVSVVPLARF